MLLGSRVLASALVAATMTAPFQCVGAPRPDQRMEEEPGQALYDLAERFKKEGNQPAQAETLRAIVERYPSSRFAEAARLDLEQMGGVPGR